MSLAPLDRAALRRMLEQIPTDPDFDGFCLDYFPEAHGRFGMGMDRAAKINLLLQLVPDLALVADKLRERFPVLPQPVAAARTRVWFVAGLAALVGLGTAAYLVRGLLSSPTVTMRVPSAVDTSTAVGRASQLDASMATPAPVGTIVDQAGDIDAKGSVNIGARARDSQTVVKTRGQIKAGGDVQIGVTTPSSPPRKRDSR